MTYEHMNAATERENKRLHERIAELEAEIERWKGLSGEKLHGTHDLEKRLCLAETRAETAEAALARAIKALKAAGEDLCHNCCGDIAPEHWEECRNVTEAITALTEKEDE